MKLPWMSLADRRRWRSARSVTDLAELMALWLEGDIASWPGYAPNWGPDEETQHLIPVLADLNRMGFLTIGSQPGKEGPGFDGKWWQQRAAVEGFITSQALYGRLLDVADREGFTVAIHRGFQLDVQDEAVPVTTHEGRICTSFGGRLSLRDMRTIWPVIREEAFQDVATAAHLTIAAPEWGAASGARLWEVLDTVTGRDRYGWSEMGTMTTNGADLSGSGYTIATPIYTRRFTHPGAPGAVIAIHHYATPALGGGFCVLRSWTLTYPVNGQPRSITTHEIGTLGPDNGRPTQAAAQSLARELTEQLTGADLNWNSEPFDGGGSVVLPRDTTAHLA